MPIKTWTYNFLNGERRDGAAATARDSVLSLIIA
jgi:hypothetical protein